MAKWSASTGIKIGWFTLTPSQVLLPVFLGHVEPPDSDVLGFLDVGPHDFTFEGELHVELGECDQDIDDGTEGLDRGALDADSA